MAHWIIPPERMIEPVVAPEFFVDGIGAIEAVGARVRAYYYVEQMPLEAGNGPPQRILTVKIVRPMAAVADSIGRMARCLAPLDPPQGNWPRVVK